MLFIFAIIALLITFILVPVLIPTLKKNEIWAKYPRRRPSKSYEKRVHQPWVV